MRQLFLLPFVALALLASVVLASCNQQTDKVSAQSFSWPDDQILPHFATPADSLDGFKVAERSITPDERLLLSSLQGIVNKTQPRIILFDRAQEGQYTWPDRLGLKVREYPAQDKWKLIRKYYGEVQGVVKYSVEKSQHYRNLATTLAGIHQALPVTDTLYHRLQEEGMELPVLVDISDLPYTTPVEIYTHLHETYWKDCTHRLIISLPQRNTGYVRDMAAATGAACTWLDPRKEEEAEVMRLFLRDMTPGESLILGWWPEERSGIGVGTEFGISTIPADYYENSTVYSAGDHTIYQPAVPRKPTLENKVYIALYMSDGDNVQYCQHAMSRLWGDEGRGKLPINWTVSPGLVDIGPGLLNYYYRTATDNDCLVSGPSGLGYALIYDAHNYKWHNNTRDLFDPYTRLTQRYLERSGLRVITIWDEVNRQQMESYADNCRYLYGLTQQDWERQEGKIPHHRIQDKLAFIPNYPCYCNGVDVIYRMNRRDLRSFDGSQPLFLSAQGESWKMGPDNIAGLKERFEELAPGKVVYCRADHFFALYNEANGMDFNLTLQPEMTISSSLPDVPSDRAADGSFSPEQAWIASAKGSQWVAFDFGKAYRINRYVVRHAESFGMDKAFNSTAFTVEVSTDGTEWQTVDSVADNNDKTTDKDIAPIDARYVRIVVTNGGQDDTVRIADVEIYGRTL